METIDPFGDAFGDLPVFDAAVPWEQAQSALEERSLGDGLPLVPPTKARLAAMLNGIVAPHKSYGQMPPLFGDLNPAAVAYNCVMAGCAPGALAVVLSAAEACLEPGFNLLGILTTTGTPAVVTIVHGPVVEDLKMNAGTNLLGPGNRANATMGRAMALVMLNIAGARAGIGDMATMGQPGKYGFCFPEGGAEGTDKTFPTLPARRGLDDGVSAVTVLGVSGTVEVLPSGGGDTPELILEPMATAMAATRAVASAGRLRDLGEQFFLLPPELAHQIAKNGWDLDRVQAYLSGFPDLAKSGGDFHPIVTGGPGIKMTHLPIWAGGSQSVTRPIRNLRHLRS
ncbi:MAG: hypothetical protein OSB58_14075 [Alphaproteobacteria bacterium]|nr:hypothetical protein [Alphaproteobacteria bacterium]